MRANLKRKKASRFFGSKVRTAVVAIGIVTLTGAVMLLAARATSETPAPASQQNRAEEPADKTEPVKKIATPKPAPSAVPVKGAPVASATAPSAVPARATEDEPVTVTGCLALDNQEYRLTDTEGENAPKSRSWKSGFLKKHGANLEVLDAANSLRLATHLGQRVTVTGVVTDRKMQARSLVVAARSCN
jgi:cell division protein FtsN